MSTFKNQSNPRQIYSTHYVKLKKKTKRLLVSTAEQFNMYVDNNLYVRNHICTNSTIFVTNFFGVFFYAFRPILAIVWPYLGHNLAIF